MPNTLKKALLLLNIKTKFSKIGFFRSLDIINTLVITDQTRISYMDPYLGNVVEIDDYPFQSKDLKKLADSIQKVKSIKEISFELRRQSLENLNQYGINALLSLVKNKNITDRLTFDFRQWHPINYFKINELLSHIAEMLNNNECKKSLKFDFDTNYIISLSSIENLMQATGSGNVAQGFSLDLPKILPENIFLALKSISAALQSGNSPINLHLGFAYTTPITSTEMALINNALSSGKCSEGLSLQIDNCQIDNNDIIRLANIISTGTCPDNLKLKLKMQIAYRANNVNDLGGVKLAASLSSGNAPKNFTLDISSHNFRTSTLAAFAKALNSGRCPEGLNLSIKGCFSSKDSQCILEALKSGVCPTNLSVNINGYGITYSVNKRIQSAVKKANKFSEAREAATDLNPQAKFKLAQYFEQGYGVKKDIEKAISLYSELASCGYQPAAKKLFSLAEHYEGGLFTQSDFSKAAKLYQVLANADYPKAIVKLKKLSTKGVIIKRPPSVVVMPKIVMAGKALSSDIDEIEMTEVKDNDSFILYHSSVSPEYTSSFVEADDARMVARLN